jgi:hypothetical protein
MGEGWTRMRTRGEDVREVGVGEAETGTKGGREEAMDQEGLMGYWDLKGCVWESVSERVWNALGSRSWGAGCELISDR